MNALTEVFKPSVIPVREQRGSVVLRHPVTGIVIFEEFRLNGKLDRTDGPACIWRDGKTGFLIGEEWYSLIIQAGSMEPCRQRITLRPPNW
jgi:hypothetical protein